MREWLDLLENHDDIEVARIDSDGGKATNFFARITGADGRKRTIGAGVYQRLDDKTATIHGNVRDEYKRSGLFRRFWRVAQELAAEEGRTLVQPDQISDEGARAWRGRNFFKGATNESLFLEFLMEADTLVQESWLDYNADNPELEETYDSFVEEVVDVLLRRGDDPDEMGLTVERIYEVKERIENEFYGTIYRVMRLKPEGIKTLKPGDSLGKHWTLNDNCVDPTNISADGDGELFWFEATISHEDIDWAMTVASDLMFGDECEINPSYHGKIVLRGIYRNGAPFTPANNLRPDLTGKVFHPGS